MASSLAGKVALVAGATRGAGRGIAVQLGAAGATVYVTGRSSGSQRSEMNRPETIEETAALVDKAGGRGIPVRVDHLVSDEVQALVQRIEREQGALHILVNDIWGATRMEWNKTVWESSLDYGLRTLRLAVDTHAITSHFAIPLLIRTPGGLVVEVGDGTTEYNDRTYRVSFFYDLAKVAVNRMAFAGFFRFTAEHPALYRVVREAEFVSPETLRLHYTRIVEGYEAGLRAAQDAGDVDRALDPEITAWALMGMGELIGMRFLLWERDGTGKPPAVLDPGVFDDMMRFIDNALAPRRDAGGRTTEGKDA